MLTVAFFVLILTQRCARVFSYIHSQRLGLGIDRVVVGRELSLSEIASVGQNSGVEIEAFVHGALCVSYSGQCFSSEAWGGRSANRGQCAQACRMPYGLIVNGTLVSLLDDVKYLLSPQVFIYGTPPYPTPLIPHIYTTIIIFSHIIQ